MSNLYTNFNVKKMKNYFPETIEKLKKLAEQGKTRNEICAEMPCSRPTLISILKANPEIFIKEARKGPKNKF